MKVLSVSPQANLSIFPQCRELSKTKPVWLEIPPEFNRYYSGNIIPQLDVTPWTTQSIESLGSNVNTAAQFSKRKNYLGTMLKLTNGDVMNAISASQVSTMLTYTSSEHILVLTTL